MLNTAQTIRLIKRLSKLSQEKLAQKLGVSFATVNSWINNKSTPRKKALERINELYRDYTGQKTIPKDVLLSKKQIIRGKSRKHKNILSIILNNTNIYEQFILSLTYNTNSIEGSTLTESDTATVLFKNIALPNKTLTEQLEAKNHQAALQYLLKYLTKKSNKIDEDLILKLHGMLMNGIRDDAGFYRCDNVRIIGANVPTANYIKIPVLMKKLVKSFESSAKDVISHASKIHSIFEKIHPFSDGNGRVGRLIMHAMLLQKNLPPAMIKQEKRQFYYTYLQKAQQKEDYSLLEDFVCDAVLDGFDLIDDLI